MKVPADPARQLKVRAAARSRSGRRFQPIAELRLEKVARGFLPLLPLSSEDVLAFREFHAPNGVPDITVVAPDPRRHERLALDVPPLLNPLDAAIAATLTPVVGKSVEEIAGRLGWREATVRRRLVGLRRSGAAIAAGADTYVRPSALTPMGRLYAVELKIDDWGRALRQCRNYRLWAESYLLVLERVPPQSLDRLRSEVKSDRGGLVVAGDLLVTPRVSRRSPEVRLWSSEHVVAELRAKSSPPRGRTH